MGKVTATLNVQEQVTWPNLTNLTDGEWDDILDMPVILEASVLHDPTEMRGKTKHQCLLLKCNAKNLLKLLPHIPYVIIFQDSKAERGVRSPP